MTYLIIFLLLFLSALFSGLTIGLLGLDKTDLERKIKIGNKYAKKIYQVRKDGNFLLVTLLIGNVLVNSTLTVFLNDITTGLIAVILSTILITLFGEILPQAIFYRYALKYGYYFVPIVRFFELILFPVAKPVALVLDKVLGKEEETVLSKEEISEMIKHHEDSEKSEIDSDEESILLGALTFSDKKIKEIMTPKKVVYSLEENTILSDELLEDIKKQGFSRIPVYRNEIDNILGVLLVKDLIVIDGGEKVSEIYKKGKIFKVNENDNLDYLLNQFINKKTHIAYVTNSFDTFLGIVTMEDLIEEIIQKEIVDETDKFKDMRKIAKN